MESKVALLSQDKIKSRFIYRSIKRGFDFIAALCGIVVLSPLMLIIATLIKREDHGPVFYEQTRVGKNGKKFKMYKFRSMFVNADQMLNELKGQNDVDGPMFKMKNDPRITRVGHFIRKHSLDELPQFFNVLKGDMSLVGPRPELPYFVENFQKSVPLYMVKHQVKPGITGLAQVKGYRGDTSIQKRIEWDIHYIENWSLFLDIKILFMTVFKGLRNEEVLPGNEEKVKEK